MVMVMMMVERGGQATADGFLSRRLLVTNLGLLGSKVTGDGTGTESLDTAEMGEDSRDGDGGGQMSTGTTPGTR